MTDSNYTHLLAIVDRSGSMFPIAGDMRGALDQYFTAQAELPGKCLVDYVQFDHEYERVFQDKPVAETKAVLDPRGSTAFLDALGKAVTDLGKKLADLPEDERPGLVQVVVVTDGHENSSRDWKPEDIKTLIAQQENDYQWDFVFLGANMDAVSVGAGFGFNPDKSLTYDVQNTGAMSASLNSYSTRSRLVGSVDNTFTSDEREAQKA